MVDAALMHISKYNQIQKFRLIVRIIYVEMLFVGTIYILVAHSL